MEQLDRADGSIPPRLPRPRIVWRAAFLLGLIPFLMGLVPIFAPNLSDARIYLRYRYVIGIILLSSPFLIPIIYWLGKSAVVLFRRGMFYVSATDSIEDLSNQLAEIKSNIFDLLQASSYQIFEINVASFVKGSIYLSISNQDGPVLSIGDKLSVVDLDDAMMLGVFEVMQIRTSDYYARASGFVDPLFSGYIRQQQQTEMLPNIVAMRIIPGKETE